MIKISLPNGMVIIASRPEEVAAIVRQFGLKAGAYGFRTFRRKKIRARKRSCIICGRRIPKHKHKYCREHSKLAGKGGGYLSKMLERQPLRVMEPNL